MASGNTPQYDLRVADYADKKSKSWKKWKFNPDHANLTIEEYIPYQMEEYLKSCWDSYTEQQVTKWNNSDSYKYILNVELPTIEWFCDMFDYPTSTFKDWKKESEIISSSFDKLLRKQAIMLQNWSISSKYSPVIAKMLLNVNHGYKEVEKKEVKHSWSIADVKVDDMAIDEAAKILQAKIK